MSDLSKYNLPSGYHNEAVAICEEFFGNESKFEEWHVRRIESALHKWMCDGARVVESKLTRPNDAKKVSLNTNEMISKFREMWIEFNSDEGRTDDLYTAFRSGFIKGFRLCENFEELPTPPKQSSEGEEG